jgi:hypothetical protein
VVQTQTQANSSQDPTSKNPSQKRAGGVTQGVGPEFKPQHCKKKKKDMLYDIVTIVNNNKSLRIDFTFSHC